MARKGNSLIRLQAAQTSGVMWTGLPVTVPGGSGTTRPRQQRNEETASKPTEIWRWIWEGSQTVAIAGRAGVQEMCLRWIYSGNVGCLCFQMLTPARVDSCDVAGELSHVCSTGSCSLSIWERKPTEMGQDLQCMDLSSKKRGSLFKYF